MRIAVDSSVILDVLTGDPVFGSSSKEALRRAYDTGALLSRDRGFFREYFSELRLIDPSEL